MTRLSPLIAAWLVSLGCAGPSGVEARSIEADRAWRSAHPLTPPIALPTRAGGASRTTVWLTIPEGALIDLDDRGELVFPTGTSADRIEEVSTQDGWAIADVRGETLTEDGGAFHLYRPVARGVGAALSGYAWDRRVGGLEDWVHAEMAQRLRSGDGLAEGVDARRREAMATGLEQRGECGRCHGPNEPADSRRHAPARRATDGHGWYVPRSIFRDEAPLERYRPDDPNEGEFVTVTCREGVATRHTEGRARRWVCPDGSGPVARFDVARARAAEDPRAIGVCASRSWLAARMTPRARANPQVRAGLVACGLSSELKE